MNKLELLFTVALLAIAVYLTWDFSNADRLFIAIVICLIVSAIRFALLFIPWWFKDR